MEIKTKSGAVGWQKRLREEFSNFSEFRWMSRSYKLAQRLGFASPEEAWNANPLVQGSANPEDYCLVLEPGSPLIVKVEVEVQVDLDDLDNPQPEWALRDAAEQAVKNAVENGEANGFQHDWVDIVCVGLVSVDVVEDCDYRTGPCPDEGCPGSMDCDECSHCGSDWRERI